MKIGINAWCFPENYTVAQSMQAAKRAGLDSIELNMAEKDSLRSHAVDASPCPVLTLETDAKELREIYAYAQRIGIEISGVSTNLHWKYSLTDSNASIREKGELIVRKMIRAAKFLHADAILVVPGLVNETVSYQSAFERSLDTLKRLSAEAEKEEITIGVENVWNKFLLSPLEMRNFIDRVGSAYVQSYFDVGNVLQYSYPEYWIEILGPRIKRIHVKDFKQSVGNIRGFTNLLEGDVNWRRVIDALKKAGYDGYVTAELSPYHYFPDQIASDVATRLRRIIA